MNQRRLSSKARNSDSSLPVAEQEQSQNCRAFWMPGLSSVVNIALMSNSIDEEHFLLEESHSQSLSSTSPLLTWLHAATDVSSL